MWPDPFAAHWNSLIILAKHQIASELATLDEIRAGKLKIGPAPTPLIATDPLEKREEAAIRKIASQPIVEESKIILEPQQIKPTPPVAPPNTTPEAALGAILKHEIRENQAKEDTFWTEERIQEALKNGEPKSRGAPCIAFCDKNNTTD